MTAATSAAAAATGCDNPVGFGCSACAYIRCTAAAAGILRTATAAAVKAACGGGALSAHKNIEHIARAHRPEAFGVAAKTASAAGHVVAAKCAAAALGSPGLNKYGSYSARHRKGLHTSGEAEGLG
ncbi:MAG: hypothetical protein MUC87_12525 [Bacteroidia bacterium]|nr:hypothetical protein [Bacteroidia bacterium]